MRRILTLIVAAVAAFSLTLFGTEHVQKQECVTDTECAQIYGTPIP